MPSFHTQLLGIIRNNRAVLKNIKQSDNHQFIDCMFDFDRYYRGCSHVLKRLNPPLSQRSDDSRVDRITYRYGEPRRIAQSILSYIGEIYQQNITTPLTNELRDIKIDKRDHAIDLVFDMLCDKTFMHLTQWSKSNDVYFSNMSAQYKELGADRGKKIDRHTNDHAPYQSFLIVRRAFSKSDSGNFTVKISFLGSNEFIEKFLTSSYSKLNYESKFSLNFDDLTVSSMLKQFDDEFIKLQRHLTSCVDVLFKLRNAFEQSDRELSMNTFRTAINSLQPTVIAHVIAAYPALKREFNVK